MTEPNRTRQRMTSMSEQLPDIATWTAGQLLTWLGTDAVRWARAFAKIERDGRLRPEDADRVGWLIGWFANAIETGRTAGRKETCAHPPERQQMLDHAELTAICHQCGTVQTAVA